MIEQGQIYMIDLEPSKGTETKKLRPYLIVSNNSYQKVFNTVIIAPISSSRKYLEPRFSSLPFFCGGATEFEGDWDHFIAALKKHWPKH